MYESGSDSKDALQCVDGSSQTSTGDLRGSLR